MTPYNHRIKPSPTRQHVHSPVFPYIALRIIVMDISLCRFKDRKRWWSNFRFQQIALRQAESHRKMGKISWRSGWSPRGLGFSLREQRHRFLGFSSRPEANPTNHDRSFKALTLVRLLNRQLFSYWKCTREQRCESIQCSPNLELRPWSSDDTSENRAFFQRIP